MDELAKKNKELWNKIIEHNLRDDLFKREDEWENANTIYPKTEGWAFGIFVGFVCALILAPFEISERFMSNSSVILGIIGGIIQHYRLKKFNKDLFHQTILIKEELLSEFESKKED